MSALNSLLRIVFDLCLAPFRGLPPIVGLAVVSLVTAVFMLVVFKATSDQARLEAVKRQIHACLFEIRLFNDDLRAILRAQGEILGHNLIYLRLSAVPMLWMIVPLVLIVAQLQFHYAYDGLRPGTSTIVKVALDAGREGPSGAPRAAGLSKPDVELEAPAGLRVDSPGVWIPSLGEMVWRIAADRPGDYLLRVRIGTEIQTKSVRVSEAVARRSPMRVDGGFLNQLIYPAESPLSASSALRSIAVIYPGRTVPVLGWGVHWMIVFFVLSIFFAFLLRKPFKVTL